MRILGRQTGKEHKSRLLLRVTNTTVAAGLLLATTAVFITTAPPRREAIDYLALGPYICILISFGFALGGLIVGSGIIFITSACESKIFFEVMTRTRSRLYCVLFSMAYPYLSVGASASACAIGLVVAAQLSELWVIKMGSILVLLIPASIIPIFTWAVI